MDELATAQASAESRRWFPLHRPVLSRWLDLALVVDQSASMVVWRQTILEFTALLERLGAFRDIRTWHIDGDRADEAALWQGRAGQARRNPRELLDPTGGRLVMVLSDCVGPAWYSGTGAGLLELWSSTGPVVVVQPLPHRLWRRCGPQFAKVRLRASRPGQPNTQLQTTITHPREVTAPAGVAVPVVELDARWLRQWAQFVSGQAAEINAVALLTQAPPAVQGEAASDEVSALQRVLRFRAHSSPEAFQLATYLSAAPLNLPVMRLIQRLLVPQSRVRHLAEVFLGDILRAVATSAPVTEADEAEYDFHPGVRDVLLRGLLARDRLRTLSIVSEFVRARLGSSLDFAATLAGAEVPTELPASSRPFALVAEATLRGMSGRYQHIADQLLKALHSGQSRVDPAVHDILASGPTPTPTKLSGVTVSEPLAIITPPTDLEQPASQPAIFGNVPPRNPNFTGREDLLQGLRKQLTGRVTALLPHALHGLGGVGKTMLAVEYVHLYSSSYELVWWVPAEQQTRVRSSLAELAGRLGMPASQDLSQSIAALYDALRTGKPYRRWLIVFDNADRPEDLSPFLSNPGGGHILITSRRPVWADVAETVEVDVFSREESIELILRRLPAASDVDANRLAERLGDLPLALEQAATWQLATATSIDAYLRLFEERVGQLLAEGTPSIYPMPVTATWGLAFDQLREVTPAAAELLELCAFFGAEPISVDLLASGRHANLSPALDGIVRDEIKLRRAVAEIGRYGLAKVDSGRNSLEVHRLVQAVLRDRLDDEQKAANRRRVHQLLAAATPFGDPVDRMQDWPVHAQLSPHILPANLIEGETRDIRKVVVDQIRYLYARGDYVSSLELARLTYHRWMDTLGPDDEQTLVTARFLGNALRSSGQIIEANELNREALARSQRVLGPDHEHTLAIGYSVGYDLRLLGEFQKAREHDEELLERHRRVLGDDEPNTLHAANNLAVDLRLLGDFQAAQGLDQKTFEGRRRQIGPEQQSTFISMSNVTRNLYGLGQFNAALQLQRQWLPRFIAVHGHDHPDVLRMARIHAATLRKTGLYDEAYEQSSGVLDLLRKGFGDNHHDTLAAMMSLANAAVKKERLDQAQVLAEDARAGYQRTLGSRHPFLHVSMTNLAIVLRARGDYAAAADLDRQALDELTTSLGDKHPYTLGCANNLTHDLVLAHDHAGAVRLSQRTYTRFEESSGTDHPETLVSAQNLALDLHATGQTSRARDLAADTLVRMARVLGSHHPDTATARAGRRIELDVDPPPL